ncbi:hypothetical protein B0H13DRAFT_2336048 [Mycena leptocephala]|nr:hypothetical protein B0H13DRAFT_2336048 [Mycena leptocephala]
MARGSQIRGKTIEAFCSLFASHDGFERSVFAKTIAANKVKAENLLFKRLSITSGYAENKIISSVRQLTIFRQRDSVGAVLPSYFNAIPLTLIALEITALEFSPSKAMESTPGPSRPSASSNRPPKPRRKVNQRVTLPGTGRFSADESLDRVPAQSIHRNSDLVITTPSNAPSFQFKPLITPLSAVHPSSSRTQPTTRVADAERWNEYNTTVVENLRRTWYRRASQTLTSPIRLTASTNIDQEQEDTLRDELAGRTVETDSEIEPDEPDEHDEPGPDVEEDP